MFLHFVEDNRPFVALSSILGEKEFAQVFKLNPFRDLNQLGDLKLSWQIAYKVCLLAVFLDRNIEILHQKIKRKWPYINDLMGSDGQYLRRLLTSVIAKKAELPTVRGDLCSFGLFILLYLYLHITSIILLRHTKRIQLQCKMHQINSKTLQKFLFARKKRRKSTLKRLKRSRIQPQHQISSNDKKMELD